MIINNKPVKDLVEALNDMIPAGSNCHDCYYRRVDKCNLLDRYLSLSPESYKKTTLCLNFKLSYQKDIPTKKTYKQRCAKTIL